MNKSVRHAFLSKINLLYVINYKMIATCTCHLNEYLQDHQTEKPTDLAQAS